MTQCNVCYIHHELAISDDILNDDDDDDDGGDDYVLVGLLSVSSHHLNCQHTSTVIRTVVVTVMSDEDCSNSFGIDRELLVTLITDSVSLASRTMASSLWNKAIRPSKPRISIGNAINTTFFPLSKQNRAQLGHRSTHWRA